jgi:hypothetical protein
LVVERQCDAFREAQRWHALVQRAGVHQRKRETILCVHIVRAPAKKFSGNCLTACRLEPIGRLQLSCCSAWAT